MSSGTLVKVERYYNRHHYRSIAEIDEKIKDTKKLIEQWWGTILGICTATPKDITPEGESPIEYIESRLFECREAINYLECELQAMCDIKEGWETKEED